MVTPQLVRNAVVWQSGMAIDADGSPEAYAPAGSGLVGLDALGNAGRPGNWWGLVCDAAGEPVCAPDGYYVSTTALIDRSKSETDPTRYVDSGAVPYVSIARDLLGKGVHLGDVAMVLFQGQRCAAIVADVSPDRHYGEGSMALAGALGIPASPRNGGVSHGVTWVVFCGSSQGWPRTNDNVASQAEQLFANWGGEPSVNGLFV